MFCSQFPALVVDKVIYYSVNPVYRESPHSANNSVPTVNTTSPLMEKPVSHVLKNMRLTEFLWVIHMTTTPSARSSGLSSINPSNLCLNRSAHYLFEQSLPRTFRFPNTYFLFRCTHGDYVTEVSTNLNSWAGHSPQSSYPVLPYVLIPRVSFARVSRSPNKKCPMHKRDEKISNMPFSYLGPPVIS